MPRMFAPDSTALSAASACILAVVMVGAVSVAQAAPRKGHSRGGAKARASAESHAREEADAVAGSRIALLDFRGDDVDRIRGQVIKVLKSKVREVSTNLKSPDTAEQYRDMGAALNLALYINGHIKDTGKDMSVLTIELRSGVNGRKLATVRFTGSRRKLYADAEDELWKKIEKPFGRACLEATKAVRHHNAPMRIEAGTPIEDSSARSSL